MRVLIVYATTEGQTLKVARFAADRLSDAGHTVEVMSADAANTQTIDFEGFERVLLMASLHTGRYQQAIADFAARNCSGLMTAGAAFVSVSLACAGEDPEDLSGLARSLTAFEQATGWTPKHVEHVAGAFRFAQYDFFKSLAMRYIAHRKGVEVDTAGDTEFTDWAAFGAFLDNWVMVDTPAPAA